MLRNASVQLSLALMTLVPYQAHFGNLQNGRSYHQGPTLKSLAERSQGIPINAARSKWFTGTSEAF